MAENTTDSGTTVPAVKPFNEWLKSTGYATEIKSIIPFEKWVLKLYDKNGDGKIGTGEKAAYNRALLPKNRMNTEAQYESYVMTTAAWNENVTNRYRALYDDEVKALNGAVTTGYTNTIAYAPVTNPTTENVEEKNINFIYIAVAAIVLVLLLKK